MPVRLRLRKREKNVEKRGDGRKAFPRQSTSLSETDHTSSSETEFSEISTCNNGRVRFHNGNKKIQKEVHVIDAVRDPLLWWDETELAHIRSTCTTVVEDCRGVPQFEEVLSDYLSMGFVQESPEAASFLVKLLFKHDQMRGLEHLCTEERQAALDDHRYNVLTTQDLVSCSHASGIDTTEALRTASLRVSRGTKRLAFRKAVYDRKAALL